MAVRFRENPVTGNRATYRYGCAVQGDVITGHEATHLVAGGGHVSEGNDLMNASWGGRYFKGDPPLLWDIGRDDYHDTVHGHSYVIESELGSTSFSTCTTGNPG